jgi:hypothetical protein
MTDMSVRDPGTGLRIPDPRTSASSASTSSVTRPTAGYAAGPAPRPAAGDSTRPGPRRPGPAADRQRTKPDPTVARLAAGAVGIAATAALVSVIAGGASAYASTPVTTATGPAASTAPVAAVPVRHVTKVVTLASNQTPPPRKIIYATPVPAPPQQTVVVRTTQSGKVLP